MDRTQFTFYKSVYDSASRIRKKADRAELYDAVCAYALFGTEPDLETLPDAVAIAFISCKPNLDSSRRKAEGGKKGGSKKQAVSKSEANDKHEESKREAKCRQSEASGKLEESGSEKENEIEKEVEREIENECYYPPTPFPQSHNSLPDHVSPAGAVIADYCNRINPSASRTCLDELKAYAEEMGEAVCKRAFDIALDSKKATWPYIRAVLQDKHRRGVRCLADWDALEENRQNAPVSQSQPQNRRKSFAEIAAEIEAERGGGLP